MKYETEGERQMMEDTQKRTGERARHHHKGRPMIGDKLIGRRESCETHGQRHTIEASESKQQKTSAEPDTTGQRGRQMKGDKTSEETDPKSRTSPARKGAK